MKSADRARLFSAVEGLTLPSPLGPIVLSGGRYPNGEGAIEVYSEQGHPLLTLTHNMDPQSMALADEQEGFWVKVNETSQIRTAVLAGLVCSGLFEPSMPPIYTGAGWVDRYAQLWGFRRCADDAHSGRWVAAILCADCLALARTGRLKVEEVQDEFRAAEIRLDPSVEYLTLIVDTDGEAEILGEFVVTSLPDPVAGSDSTFDTDFRLVQPDSGVVEQDSPTEQAEEDDEPMGRGEPFGSGLIPTPTSDEAS